MSADSSTHPLSSMFSIRCWLAAMALFVALWLGCQQTDSKPSIVVSKETTYITEPLRDDGLPDYERWLLEKYRDGVTHENNAGVLLFQANWPAWLEPADYQLICDELGLVAIPSEDGALRDFPNEELVAAVQSLLVGQGIKTEDNSLAEDAVYSATDAAWTTRDLPPLADWLAANQGAIDLVVEASNRSHLYLPSPSLLNTDHDMLIAMLLPGVQGTREASRALAVRSMWRNGEGRPSEAWKDALALHRLACLSSRGNTIVEKLVAIAMHGMAGSATLAILSQEEIPLELARQIQTDLAKLNSQVSIAESLRAIERVSTLDAAIHMALYGPGVLDGGSNDKQWPASTSIDWNIVLRSLNGWYDKLEAIVAIEDYEERQQAFANFEAEMRSCEESLKHPMTAAKAFFSRQARSESIATVHAALMMPATEAAMAAEYRSTTQSQLLQLAAALTVYRAEHGRYPDRLEQLVPDVIPKLPVDLYHAKQFIYHRDADGYLLYCAGPNGIDDGGCNDLYGGGILAGRELGWDENDATEALRQQIPAGADDLAIRLPRPPFQLPTPQADQP